MKSKRIMPGLIQFRNGTIQIDWTNNHKRHVETLPTTNVKEAKEYFDRFKAEVHRTDFYGEQPTHSFREAADRFVYEKRELLTIQQEEGKLNRVCEFLGDIPIQLFCWEILEEYVTSLQSKGRKNATINHYVGTVRRVLEASCRWKNDNGTVWLNKAPYFPTFDAKRDAKVRQPITVEAQETLFSALPMHLREMAEFAVNTGARNKGICELKWSDEFRDPSLTRSVFEVQNKGGGYYIAPLNAISQAVIERQRGRHPEYVFTYEGSPLSSMHTKTWKRVAKELGVETTPHYLRHTFASRLSAASVRDEDIARLLGHKRGNVTMRYTQPGLQRLIDLVANLEPDADGNLKDLVILQVRQ